MPANDRPPSAERTPAERRAARRHIAAVVDRFRAASLAVRIPLRERVSYWWYYVGLARRGRMVYSPERDAVYADGYWKRGFDKFDRRINARLARRAAEPEVVAVPSFAAGELHVDDVEQLMRAQVPFVLRGGAAHLPARGWSLDYLHAVAGDCEVPINEAGDEPSADLDRPTKAHHYYAFRTGRLDEVLTSVATGGRMRATTAEDVMHHGDGQLRKDLDLAYFERLTGWEKSQRHALRKRMLIGKIVGAQLLVQPAGAFTLWHAEPGDNFFVLAHGQKTWTLADPYYTPAMRPRVKATTNYHGSNIDLRESDDVLRRRGFGGYLRIPKVRVQLESGDVLRVPHHWWHSVSTDAREHTIAVSIRLNGWPTANSPALTWLRWRDPQFHAIVAAYARDGRIADRHIGFPRPSRSSQRDTA